jgi:hypothetical protein
VELRALDPGPLPRQLGHTRRMRSRRALLGACSLVLVLLFGSPTARQDCWDPAVPQEALEGALLEGFADRGSVEAVLSTVPATLRDAPGEHLFAAMVTGRFRVDGPVTFRDGDPERVVVRGLHRGMVVFRRTGDVLRVGLWSEGLSSNPVDRRIFGLCNR